MKFLSSKFLIKKDRTSRFYALCFLDFRQRLHMADTTDWNGRTMVHFSTWFLLLIIIIGGETGLTCKVRLFQGNISLPSWAAGPDSHSGISHLTLWPLFPPQWGPQWTLGLIPSSGRRFDGNTNTRSNRRDVISAKRTNIINSGHCIHSDAARRANNVEDTQPIWQSCLKRPDFSLCCSKFHVCLHCF